MLYNLIVGKKTGRYSREEKAPRFKIHRLGEFQMSVSTKPRTVHQEPIYFVALESTGAGTLLVTNTQSGRAQTGPDGFPVQYRQTINLESGAVTCSCPGFQDSIAPRAHRAGIVPTLANEKTCCHIRRAAESGREWQYISEPAPVVEAPAAFDYVAFFES
jgi:hypothetical protein